MPEWECKAGLGSNDQIHIQSVPRCNAQKYGLIFIKLYINLQGEGKAERKTNTRAQPILEVVAKPATDPCELELSTSRPSHHTPHSLSRNPTPPPLATMALLSVDQKRLMATKFPPEFNQKVDIEKVNIDLIKRWIANKLTTILGNEDDIIVETCYNLIEQSQFPKIKEIQIQLTGFLEKETAPFCKELWNLMLSAQESPMGVPRELLEAKKAELQKEQLSKATADARRAESQAQNTMVDSFRRSERSDRPERGRGGGGGGRYRGSDREEDIPHQTVSAMSTCPEAADAEGGMTGLANAVVRTVILHPHHIVVHVAHHRQDHRAVRPGAERVAHHPPIVLGLRLAARDAGLLHEAIPHLLDGGKRAGIGLGLLIRTREGTLRDLALPVTSRAHQRPGSEQGHRRTALHAVEVALLRGLPDL
ncbi:PWI domain-containing protein C825.05c [Curvularia clavata]|uniref:PWI domain-containing protein C825.05c n=1 Tax=Curvularia clavata TaxID=95742 RepID=A0A9Q9DRY0_CURCL|nr:PWI domain-containing protein C825.05c [Curvularia clavata]